MSSTDTPVCIGRYCGFQPNEGVPGQWNMDKCGACPRGFRSNQTKYCVKCEEPPDPYEWHFLFFMIVLPCMLNWIFIIRNFSRVRISAIQMLLSLAECVMAAVFALLCTEPIGTLSIVSCGVERLSDWYPMFYNPQVQYTETIHCTQEIVYPLLTTVCIYYAFLLVIMVMCRPLLLRLIDASKQWQDPIYASLYSLPILVVTQAVGGGLIYYAYPYISIILSVVSVSIYFVWSDIRSLSSLRQEAIWNILIILWHAAMIGFGITSFQTNNFYYLGLVIVPVLFYFMTVRFTDPNNIKAETPS